MSKARKAGDNIKVPARESTMKHEATPLPSVFKMGSLVRYWPDGDTPGCTCTGWIIQTPLSPGGQTNSYLLIPFPSFTAVICGSVYTVPIRIDRDQVIEVLEPELP
jgi:hypothetical protein